MLLLYDISWAVQEQNKSSNLDSRPSTTWPQVSFSKICAFIFLFHLCAVTREGQKREPGNGLKICNVFFKLLYCQWWWSQLGKKKTQSKGSHRFAEDAGQLIWSEAIVQAVGGNPVQADSGPLEWLSSRVPVTIWDSVLCEEKELISEGQSLSTRLGHTWLIFLLHMTLPCMDFFLTLITHVQLAVLCGAEWCVTTEGF